MSRMIGMGIKTKIESNENKEVTKLKAELKKALERNNELITNIKCSEDKNRELEKVVAELKK